MKDGLKIINFVLKHDEELRKKYLNIKNNLTKEFLKEIENEDFVTLADSTSNVQTSEKNNKYIFYGRDKRHDCEFEFVVDKSLINTDKTLFEKNITELGCFYVEEEDRVTKHLVVLMDVNSNPALMIYKFVYSRENANVEYEPAITQVLKVDYNEIEKLFTDGIKPKYI